MSYAVSIEKMDKVLKELKKKYRVYAPIRFEKRGRYSDTDLIRYAEIDSVKDVVYNEKSDFSPKEVIHPITQTLFHFTEYEYRESQIDDKEILIFAHPCDINGIKRLDTIFLENGNNEDVYYKRLRDKVKFVLMECQEDWDTCFCISMGSNQTDDYSLAIKFGEDQLSVEVKDNEFEGFFASEEEIDFTYKFVTANQEEVNLPKIDDKEMLKKVYDLKMWEDYNARCKDCGACTSACVTCSCFTTSDVIYSENGRVGERRRVWASCQHEDFTEMAGGHSFRNTPADRMRFRTLHKVYDYKERFGEEHMCVGCGRCTDRCNQLISFSKTINKLTEEVNRLQKEVN
ncbi:anaerobic sulfite reductase subunit A [Orenia metallireducens]|jgi:anaerobic sulfite reductase subunit A|uniref:Anaerobic sulfite reductase subunit A n=1 Tax=Orenia metallireducens TaxID=1413210 RepID=A0A285HDB2_9FIRM|nr:anaerobic sulfite reductase subunit AsrA [Orenia metallireducens]PRX28962.1 anaerobic sulfite reductase subunit A [Orenia metallireducens]SNY32826.1 anaerobic sulfite reductase subunit A [Orenia metallireducens]